jgi:peptidoglycan/LPS O-acetylase OafA/YrhL
MQTLAVQHHANAFDLVRLIAAWLVLFSHSFPLLGLEEPRVAPLDMTVGSTAVAVFFAVSGYLVCQSWERDPHFGRFLLRRALRIFPGLVIAVAFTALVVGTAVSIQPWRAHVTSTSTWYYLIDNMLAIGNRTTLPGVFEKMPNSSPNGSLWTLRYEILMYLMLVLLGITRHLKLAAVATFLTFSVTTAVLAWQGTLSLLQPIPGLWRIGLEFDLVRVAHLGSYFFGAVVLCLFKAHIQLTRWRLFIAAAIGAALCLLAWTAGLPWGLFAGLLFLPLATVLISSRPSRLGGFIRHDLSYGIYIYAFPIQQCVCMLALVYGWTWTTALALSTAVTVAAAAASWIFFEKPALGFKPKTRPPAPALSGAA